MLGKTDSGRSHVAIALSACVHGLVVAAGLWIPTVWSVEELSSPSIGVRFVSLPPALAQAPSYPRRVSRAPGPASSLRRSVRASSHHTEDGQAPQQPGNMEAGAHRSQRDEQSDENYQAPASQAEGGESVEPSIAAIPSTGAASPATPLVLDEAKRRSILALYLQNVLRGRIMDKFQYPSLAEEQGLAGTVVVRLTIAITGALLDVRVVGRCPHDLLCEAAINTVRRASPFPAAPIELGPHIQVDVPLHYSLSQ